jgi:hypothetical protein
MRVRRPSNYYSSRIQNYDLDDIDEETEFGHKRVRSNVFYNLKKRRGKVL